MSLDIIAWTINRLFVDVLPRCPCLCIRDADFSAECHFLTAAIRTEPPRFDLQHV